MIDPKPILALAFITTPGITMVPAPIIAVWLIDENG
jgi:hypothetical protein